ncbi:polysaccharide deacetylase family protein [Lysobacter soli]|uniref:Polysaccharide deacetylase family protein n=1 Tax=Lysobacter soli TaxID=453783 RepID=A0A3D8VJN2_9GAMM|nr:polysaccharide deacetylase family protein [Lysobacter soli]RDY69523.1 polysaccharide deacetylase family protein [Lysobacter soli]
MGTLPILMYHGLHREESSRGRFDPVYSVHPEMFARQLDWLVQQGHRAPLLEDALSSANGTRDVIITFDDGDVSNVEIAMPLLLERGLRAEFFVTTDFIGQCGMLAPDDIRRLAANGMGIGSHGRTHSFLSDLDVADLTAELDDSRCRLQQICGRPIDSLALPGGRGGERELLAAQQLGYRHLLGSVPGPNKRRRSDTWLQRLPVTRNLSLDDFAALVHWRGLPARWMQARHAALALPKRVLGNDGYQRLRERLL